jgi:hypothetical protein
MENETSVQAPGPQATQLPALVPLADFKAIVGIDDREDTLSRYCLITATYAIEQYCLRRLRMKRHGERIEFYGEPLLPLREYPVREVLAAYVMKNEELIEPEFYRVIPDLEGETGAGPEETVYSLMLSPGLFRGRGGEAVKVVYRAGYSCGEAPPDLAAACLELAAGLKTFVLNGDLLCPTPCDLIHPHAQCFACIIGWEYDPLPGKADRDDRERPGER